MQSQHALQWGAGGACSQGCLVWEGLLWGVPGGGGFCSGGCLVETPSRTATAADGTHPTGMHSCFGFTVSLKYLKLYVSEKKWKTLGPWLMRKILRMCWCFENVKQILILKQVATCKLTGTKIAVNTDTFTICYCCACVLYVTHS